MDTTHYKYKNIKSSDLSPKDDSTLTRALERAVAMNRRIRSCDCGSYDVEYQGCGSYLCKSCNKELFDNYGKVRQCVKGFGIISVDEVIARTGLTRADINELAREGSIRIFSGRIDV